MSEEDYIAVQEGIEANLRPHVIQALDACRDLTIEFAEGHDADDTALGAVLGMVQDIAREWMASGKTQPNP